MVKAGLLLVLLTSCSMYKSHFDCPPGKGVGCKSVSEIEGMIVESETGPDRFEFKEPCTACRGG